jgi:MoaA/NifB/PqqE/SkfB family radical SAM enzyme
MKANDLRQNLLDKYGKERPQIKSGGLQLRHLAMLQSLKLLLAAFPYASEDNIVKLINLYAKIFSHGNSNDQVVLENYLKTSSLGALAYRISRLVSHKALEQFVFKFLINGLIVREPKRLALEREGRAQLYALLISPTAKCNLHCTGCFAHNYSIKGEMPFELIDRVMTEAEKMGVALFTILGGEPFLYGRLFDLIKRHYGSYFLIFTNGTLINPQVAREIKNWGNILLILSLEGFQSQTDARRGKGVFTKLMSTMDLLRQEKIPFGYSVTVTKKNEPVIASEEFVDLLIAKGALMGWFFLCMPVAGDPDIDLLPTPEQRAHLLSFVNLVRETRSIFLIDFWNDAPYVGGCIAGKYYAHVTSQGWVEPCIFTHFCQDNVKDKSLKEALNSEFFRSLRKRQPFNDNLFLPCMWIDNPQVSRKFYADLKLKPTHAGASDILTKPELLGKIDEYSREVNELYRSIWQQQPYDAEGFLELKKSVMKMFCD